MTALTAMDQVAFDAFALTAIALGLHVFALDTRAQALCHAAGYGITGFGMLKRLCRDA